MAKVINCECGFVARGDSDDEVVEVIQGHMASDHPQKFDPAAYKRTTRDQWDNAADAWDGWGPTIEELLDGATSTMFDLARIRPGARVLDVAAGAGGQSVAAARRAGPDGWVLATDLSPVILERARCRFERAGLASAAIRVMDGENLAVAPSSFDAVISRLGTIYLPDRAAALASARQALRPGGRLAVIVYGTAPQNGFFSVPVSIIRQAAGLGAPLPGQPGPFSLGADGVLATELAAAGFSDIEVRAIEAPVRMPSAAECLRFERESFGALHQMLSGLPERQREAAWAEAGAALAKFEFPGGFTGPCALLVAAGTR